MIAWQANAQQLPQYSQYALNDYVINPAVGGTRPYFEAKSNNRYQWVGITDAPRTYILSMAGPTKRLHFGWGGYIFTDITGPTRRTGGYATYSYNIKLTSKIKMSFGLSAGLLQFAVDGSKITLRESGDLALSNAYQSVIVPDAGAGIYVYSEKFYFGFSAPQLMQNKLKFFENQTGAQGKLEDHYFAVAGYKQPFGSDFIIEPMVMVKYVSPVNPQLDATLRVHYKNMMWLGGTFRTEDAYSVMAGYLLNNRFTFGYSYDVTTSNLSKFSSGTHEVMLGLRFLPKKKESVPQTAQ